MAFLYETPAESQPTTMRSFWEVEDMSMFVCGVLELRGVVFLLEGAAFRLAYDVEVAAGIAARLGRGRGVRELAVGGVDFFACAFNDLVDGAVYDAFEGLGDVLDV